MLAVLVAKVCGVSTALVDGGDYFHHVGLRAEPGQWLPDTGAICQVGPRWWWRYVEADDVAMIVRIWLAQGRIILGRSVSPPTKCALSGFIQDLTHN